VNELLLTTYGVRGEGWTETFGTLWRPLPWAIPPLSYPLPLPQLSSIHGGEFKFSENQIIIVMMMMMKE
jgi:hypothetical protein